MLFGRSGQIVSQAQQEHRQIYPQPGWVEHDPMEIWHCTGDVVGRAVKAAGGPGQIAAVGITNQRETVVLWDRRTGRPLCNAIVWQDTRSQAVCDELAKTGGANRFADKTGLPLATYFSGPKIRWALDNIDTVAEAAQNGNALCGTIDSWLIWKLTGAVAGGRFVTDVTTASRTLMMNLQTLAWDGELLEALGIDAAMLPRIVSTNHPEAFGRTRADGPFGAGLPITAAVGDQHGALIGQCCFEFGQVKNTYGTGCFVLMNTGGELVRSQHGMLTTLAYQFAGAPPAYALEGSIAVAGSLVQWLRDNLGLINEAAEIETLAAGVDDNGGVYIVPAFSGLFAPHWRPDARGVIVGLTGFANKGHIARAALEAITYQTKDVLGAMGRDADVQVDALKVDGGMVVNDLLMQLQADILGIDVVRPLVNETTALGAAYAAGLAIGFYKGLDEVREHWRAMRTWQPTIDEQTRAYQYAGWQKALERSFGWVQ